MKSNTLRNKSFMNTRSLVTISLMTTLSIVLARILGLLIPIAGLPALKINFSGIPLILTGIFFGPAAGFMAGAVADIIGYMINPMGGAFFPGFTLTTALTGAIPGFLFKVFKRNAFLTKRNFNYYNCLFIILMTIGLLYALYLRGVLSFDGGLHYNGNPVSFVVIFFFLIAVTLYAVVPFVINQFLGTKYGIYTFDKLYFTVSTTQFITSLLLNTYFLSLLFGRSFIVFLPTRIMTTYFMIPIFTFLLMTLIRILKLDRQAYH